jgi:signal transduction histidine kinase/DNA-binding response OmpR family regulator
MSQNNKIILYKEPDRKILQSICLYGLCIVFIRLVIYLSIGTSWLPLIADSVMGITGIGIYFLLKKTEDFTAIFWPVVLATQISSIFFWFGTGGIEGPTIIFNLSLIVVYIVIDPRSQYWIVGAFGGLVTLFTIVLEQYNPTWVVPYPSVLIERIDTGVVFITMVVLVTLTTRFMKSRYENEQKLTNKKADELALAKKNAEENRDLLETIKEFQSSFLLEEQAEYSFDTLLKQLLTITNSQYGFIAELIYEEEGTTLDALAVVDTKGALMKHGDLLQDTNWQEKGTSTLEPLLGTILKEETYILSDIVPQNYTDLKHFLGFPITHNNKIVGILGLSNLIGYEDLLAETLAPFLSTYGTIIQNIRLKRTQKKYKEELQRAKETAEQAVLAKNRLFTNISHEFRTPLSLIVGPVSAILKQPQGSLNEIETRDSLDMVLRNSKKVLNYIDDIMDLAKLNSNKLEVRTETNRLYSFITGIHNTFKVQKNYRKINYQLEYNVDHNLVIDFDSYKMEKIINNLLSNAFKYTADSGAITMSITDTGTAIKVEVQDTGIGIKAEDLPHIFERFYQTKEAKKTAVSGSGVGLALAQELASLQGFEIYVQSVLNKGTTFSFLMPKVESLVSMPNNEAELEPKPVNITAAIEEEEEEKIEGTENGTPISSEGKKPSILIVEDNNDMAMFIKMVLGTQYDISLAENGLVALNILKENSSQFDLIITDLMMPEMDGYELLEHIKASTWGTNLPVIVLTAKSGEASKLKTLAIGVDEYLTKPFSVEELNIHVKRLIENALVRKDWKDKETEEDEVTPAQPVTDTSAPVAAKESALSIAVREKIEAAREVVLKNIDETEFTVDDLARAVAVSKRQLYRFMQANVGLTPLKFINEIRLQEARTLLEEGTCSTVKEVSYSIGFMSARHFSKNYATRFGKKPSEYFK